MAAHRAKSGPGDTRRWRYWLCRELGVPLRRGRRPGKRADGRPMQQAKPDAPVYAELASKRWLCA